MIRRALRGLNVATGLLLVALDAIDHDLGEWFFRRVRWPILRHSIRRALREMT